ncbi:MAG: CoA-transferase [Peptostreptococcus porci]|uniref:acyl CoA:acetate/3-ketoacid CoA transferase n=1 Tax=Peptostreptococcus porci TaxID=2652282 RepID=UPI002A7FC111|nr:CoA-transferase [Peptostreptococcus porci]MDY4128718.1 CoA-transferase [Peptostreptococcus porci]MDY4560301.1 CoA-transferase [Peptostreptococcus porci]
MNKNVKLDEAINLIKDGDTVALSGFMLATAAREIMVGIGERFKNTGSPRGLTVYQGAGIGNNRDQGVCEMSFPGLIKRYVTAHFANNQPMIKMALNNEVEAYNFPQGVISHLYRQAAGKKPFEITRIGLNTYCDPRLKGGKVNEAAKEDLVELIHIDDVEYLKYKVPKYDIGIIRGTTADEHGNITMEDESSIIDSLDIAMAVKASGGKVIVQVKNIVSSASINRKDVVIPGVFVDAVVISEEPETYHRQTPGTFYSPVIAGKYNSNEFSISGVIFDERKIIARRAIEELKSGSVVNLGIGIPEAVSSAAVEAGISDIVLTVESGLIGGIPLGGSNFGSAVNAWASLPMASQFDFYNSGGLDKSFLGFAQIDSNGNINVSRFGDRIGGCGGFIDITQSTKNIVFCGTMTSNGLKTKFENGKLVILSEGKTKKFKNSIDEITFSAHQSRINEQNVILVTERCVFKYDDEGLILTEVAPGIDIESEIFGVMDFRTRISENLKLMDRKIFDK